MGLNKQRDNEFAEDRRQPKGETEAVFRTSDKGFRLLVEQAGDSFFVHTYSGKILDVNRQACRTLGYSRNELLRMEITDIDIEINKNKHISRFWERLASGEYVTFEGVQIRKNRTTFPVEVRLGRLDLGDQKLLLSLTRDITERKRAEDELKRALKEITELKNQLEKENVHLRKEIESTYRYERIIGESDVVKKVLAMAEKVAKEDTYVLIRGKQGPVRNCWQGRFTT